MTDLGLTESKNKRPTFLLRGEGWDGIMGCLSRCNVVTVIFRCGYFFPTG